MSSGSDAGDATTVVAANVVATVGIERCSAPSRLSGARAARNAQAIVARDSTTVMTIESGKRSANGRARISGSATSTAVSDAQYASLIVVTRPTRSVSVARVGSGASSGRWSTTSEGSRAQRA